MVVIVRYIKVSALVNSSAIRSVEPGLVALSVGIAVFTVMSCKQFLIGNGLGGSIVIIYVDCTEIPDFIALINDAVQFGSVSIEIDAAASV